MHELLGEVFSYPGWTQGAVLLGNAGAITASAANTQDPRRSVYWPLRDLQRVLFGIEASAPRENRPASELTFHGCDAPPALES